MAVMAVIFAAVSFVGIMQTMSKDIVQVKISQNQILIKLLAPGKNGPVGI